MVSKTRAWFNRLGSNVSHIVSGAVHGVENNIGPEIKRRQKKQKKMNQH